ncbi:VWA domain-containing protein [Chitinophaga silvatica]|uniref:VWA domain-containing protein n=1 Tax=Chitinophaga silvatica TaxID=2282649 RepID=A0A3E1Y425_9BACT|nr:VWA domain-containing protein [Chitinophaga silvatica]RFS19247.1 VWA domain-containing protein [Chitinophaga silvatica]
MKVTLFTGLLLASGFLAWKHDSKLQSIEKEYTKPAISSPSAKDNTRIQVAILLDTSNSMDGLIDQAKSRLWNIINTLTTLKFQGKAPIIEIALYEYGNDWLSRETGFIRQVAPLTTDLDLISEKLFALKTNGGEEYCGAVIKKAVNSLDWGYNPADLKLIYIAGNEEFTQGKVNYVSAASEALSKEIYVNTIFCGSKQEGIAIKWKDGADKGGGKYFNIDSDRKVDFIETPYDSLITVYNSKINSTYFGYGRYGASKKSNQLQQDANASSISRANSIERFVSKSKSVYKNDTWDLVELNEKDPTLLSKISQSELPQELQGKSTSELKQIVVAKGKERDSIQKAMVVLGNKRQKYIDEKMKSSSKADDLGTAIKQSIITFAVTKGYTAEK